MPAGASPRLTFHPVDIFSGATAAGLKLELSRFEGGAFKRIETVETVAGGRPAEPLLVGDAYLPVLFSPWGYSSYRGS